MLKNKRKTCQERERKEKGYIRLKKTILMLMSLFLIKRLNGYDFVT
jgi:hypothetical protein